MTPICRRSARSYPDPTAASNVAALGGSIASRAASAGAVQGVISSPATVGASGTSITVTDTQAGVEIKPKQETPKPAQAQTQVTTQISPILDMSGVEKSALYKINPDNTVETLWSSKEENIYDVLLSGAQLVFATDLQGRIYRMTPDRKAALLLQTNESETTRLLEAGGSVLASTSNMGKIFRMGAGYGSIGSFESPVHDAGSVARWGRLSWRASKEQDCRLAFRTRSGNSARPDKTWSDWSEALDGAGSAVVKSPNARYVQWRADFGGAGKSALLDTVIVTYLPQNATPVVKSIGVKHAGRDRRGADEIHRQCGLADRQLQHYRLGHPGQRSGGFGGNIHTGAIAERFAAAPDQLAGGRSGWRPVGLCRLFPR